MLGKYINSLAKDIFAYFGFQVERISISNNPSYQLFQALNKFDVNLVFDVGANSGQFAKKLRRVGYSGKIVSFEPLSDAHAMLVDNSAYDKEWIVHEQSAVGDTNGYIQINVAGNSVSSSVLPMLESHSSAASGSSYVSSESVPVCTLDSVAREYIYDDSNYFIKIDTQGFEWEVLNGACDMLKYASGVQLELSLVPLYDGQRLWREIIQRMDEDGFTLWALQRGFTDRRDGRTLQIDAIFFRLSSESRGDK